MELLKPNCDGIDDFDFLLGRWRVVNRRLVKRLQDCNEWETFVFECDDELDGRPVRVRYTWSDITPDSARWEQAMSPDHGKTWEMNWSMLFERIDRAPIPS